MQGYSATPPGSIWGGMREFAARGGFVNGLIPNLVGRVWYVHGEGPDGENYGGDSNTGLAPTSAFATIARALEMCDSYDTIVLSGVFREQCVAPDGVFDVKIIGAGNRPRQATSGGVPTGGGASWLSPTTPVATTPLLELVRSGWVISNIQMAPVAASACIRLTRSATDDLIDASHCILDNLYLVGGGLTGIGIEDNGGCSRVLVQNSRFEAIADSAIKSISTANSVPLAWLIQDNRFQQNLNDIKMSLSYAVVQRNRFMTAGSGATNKIISDTFIAVQGGNNQILLNQFSNTEAEIAPGNGYTGAASDTWMNYVNNQAALAFGLPA